MISLNLLFRVGGLLMILMSRGDTGYLILGTLWVVAGILEAILSEMRDKNG